MQMLFFAMLIEAAHPVLEDRKEPNRIGVNVATHIFAARMNGRFVGRKFLADVAVKLAFIGV